ncbi:uncharacterized protein N7518_003603 [Penicillium psychrosexuale]|uniref:uncharacterized protein n=1 Tax=Penicillium psychrosexuale TaxID=1002107 RepID=UPI0025454868|nr:uncharacterized protein N7518_003603 [Penicillium psychrosexuale]KAJ5801535.1 hypothetical protein N7518_003603 [Penicillium psychrosexuale]
MSQHSGVALGAPWDPYRHAFEVGIINLKDSIDRRAVLANTIPLDCEAIEALSTHIWETKIEFARVIRNFHDPLGAAMLADLFQRLIGTMPNADGVIP